MICPICKRKLDAVMRAARTAPFCSRRCADVDLGRWLTEGYRVAGEAAETSVNGGGAESGMPEDENPG